MKRKTTGKRLLSALLALVMVCSTWLMDTPVQAADSLLPSATNVTFDSARQIIMNSSMSESTTNSDQIRYYKFSLKQASELVLRGYRNWSMKLTVYDASRTEVWTSGWSSYGGFSYSVILTGGSYYIKAESTDPYNMTATISSLGESFKETQDKNNDLNGTASKISLKKKYKGVLAENDPIDYYKFTIPAKGKINLSTTSGISDTAKYVIYNKNLDEVYSFTLNSGRKYSQLIDIASGTYYLAVCQNTIGRGTGNYNFTIDYSVKTPSKVNVTGVKNVSGKKLNVKWKKVSGAAGYELQYATSSNFKSGLTKKTVSSKKTSVTYTKLKKNKTYYVRMRAYVNVNGKKVYGSWSNKKKIKIRK